MKKTILKFTDIVQVYEIEPEISDFNKLIQEARITFIDSTKLVAKDILIFLDKDSVRRKYSFQWMNSDNKLIIRWDNAPHHKACTDTFPHHKHVHSESNVNSSPEMTLFLVLSHIREVMSNDR